MNFAESASCKRAHSVYAESLDVKHKRHDSIGQLTAPLLCSPCLRGTLPESTDIKICGETPAMKGEDNLDLWLVAPTDDMHTKSIVGWSLEAALSFLWCQCTMVLHFGPRTWSSNGVGIMNLGLQDCFRGSPNERSEEIDLCSTGSVLFARALCLTLPIAVSMT